MNSTDTSCSVRGSERVDGVFLERKGRTEEVASFETGEVGNK